MQAVDTVKFANLRAKMARHGVSNKHLAEILGVSVVTIRSRFSGKSKWTIDDANTLAKYFDSNIDYLFFDEE